MLSGPSATRPGQRERQKTARRQRIMIAARQTFGRQGYDEATTAEIAKAAGVGAGTLFRYVADKHELLLMVVNDDLAAVTDAGIDAMKKPGPLLSCLIRLYRPRFAYWASDLALARSASAGIFAIQGPSQKPEFSRVGRRQERIIHELTDLIRRHCAENGLALRMSAALIARSIHYLYIGELRTWMNAKDPRVDKGVAELRQLFELLLEGAFSKARKKGDTP